MENRTLLQKMFQLHSNSSLVCLLGVAFRRGIVEQSVRFSLHDTASAWWKMNDQV